MPLSSSPPRADPFLGARLGTAFQPVISLDTGDVVASEALLRPMIDGQGVSPEELLNWARVQGVLEGLDLAALGSSVANAGEAGPGTLLVNVEPSTLVAHTDEVIRILDSRAPGIQIVVEVTERALAADPAGLLRATEELNAHGYPIALDDVGAIPDSLALLDVIRPSIVKLDMTLLRESSDPANLQVAGAVSAYTEATGAQVIAEGIETQEDLMRARILGANLGQGWLWGRPGTSWIEQKPASMLRVVPPKSLALPRAGDTPFSIVARHRPTHTATKKLLLPLSFAIEASATQAHLPAILLATFQHVRNVPRSTFTRYEEFAAKLPLVGMFGEGLASLPIAGAHLAHLSPDDPLCREWSVVALGAQSAVALIAREEPTEPGGDRMFSFATTYDRALVVAAAKSLIHYLGARP